MKEVLNSFFIQLGYFNVFTTLPEFQIYFLPSCGAVEVVMAVDYQKEIYLSEEVYDSVREKFVQSFKERGFSNVHMLTLVMCRDTEKMESIFGGDRFCWYLNSDENKLYISDGHVEDFYGLKEKVQKFLENPEIYATPEEDGVSDVSIPWSQRLKGLPFINIAIVAINIIVFILCTFIPDMLYNKGAFSFLFVEESKEYYRLLTNIFIHADINHLFSNMLILFFLGNIVEEKIGHTKYFLLYFISAMAGNVASSVYEIQLNQMYFTVGASGAIFGVIGAVLMLVLTEGGRWETITLPGMLLMLGYSLYSGFVVESVNNAAHIGGMLAGFIVMGMFCVINMLRKKKEVLHEN